MKTTNSNDTLRARIARYVTDHDGQLTIEHVPQICRGRDEQPRCWGGLGIVCDTAEEAHAQLDGIIALFGGAVHEADVDISTINAA